MQIAGAFGLAVLSTLATGHTRAELGEGVARAVAFTDGFTLAAMVGGLAVLGGIAVALVTLRGGRDGADPAVLRVEAEEDLQAIAA